MIKDTIASISSPLRDNVVALIAKICATANTIFKYLDKMAERKESSRLKKDIGKADSEIGKACEKGNLTDLVNAVENRRRVEAPIMAVAAALLVCGCTTIEVHATKSWEGRYSDRKSAEKAVSRIELGRNESVWILSNETLKRILTTDKERQ